MTNVRAIQAAGVEWIPTRAAALARLDDFLPRAGRAYAKDRNVDRGQDKSNVSVLSPYLRRRLITEVRPFSSPLNHPQNIKRKTPNIPIKDT